MRVRAQDTNAWRQRQLSVSEDAQGTDKVWNRRGVAHLIKLETCIVDIDVFSLRAIKDAMELSTLLSRRQFQDSFGSFMLLVDQA
jgi:hypothetical protein